MCPLFFLTINVVFNDLKKSPISITAPFVDLVQEKKGYVSGRCFVEVGVQKKVIKTTFYVILSCVCCK